MNLVFVESNGPIEMLKSQIRHNSIYNYVDKTIKVVLQKH